MSDHPELDKAEARFNTATAALLPLLRTIAKSDSKHFQGPRLRIFVRGMSLGMHPELAGAPSPVISASDAEKLAPLLGEFYQSLDAWWRVFYGIGATDQESVNSPPQKYPNPIHLAQANQSASVATSGSEAGSTERSEDEILMEQMLLDQFLN